LRAAVGWARAWRVCVRGARGQGRANERAGVIERVEVIERGLVRRARCWTWNAGYGSYDCMILREGAAHLSSLVRSKMLHQSMRERRKAHDNTSVVGGERDFKGAYCTLERYLQGHTCTQTTVKPNPTYHNRQRGTRDMSWMQERQER
jgi:hypothetical protein